MIKEDIEKAIKQLNENLTKYAKFDRYYEGNHDLAFATDKFKNAFGALFRAFSLNLCPAVCDALRDKLKVKNFKVEEGSSGLPTEAWKIWQSNRMGMRSGEIHKEAIKKGDAYAIVWVDPNKKVTIYPQSAEQCTVVYDEEMPGKILWAAKTWLTAKKKTRINLYYPDRTERYISKEKTENGLPSVADLEPFTDDGEAVIANSYNIVPVFHFANNSNLGTFGQSELKNAVNVQDALNKSVLDMLVAMEFASFKQRYAAGIEIEYDDGGNPIPPFQGGIDRIWTTDSPDVKFGEFSSADLEQFLKVKADFRIDLACVTGTPLYYFMLPSGTMPSGESLKKSETRFINKVTDRQESFGQVWEDVMSFALLLEGKGKEIRLFTDWAEPSPMSETEKLSNIIIKKEIGISDAQALVEAGYGETDIAKMLQANQTKADATISGFNAGYNDGIT